MLLIMNDGQLQTIEQVRGFLEGSEEVGFRVLPNKGSDNRFAERMLKARSNLFQGGNASKLLPPKEYAEMTA